MTNKELSQITNKSPQFISKLKKRLGRQPTIEEIHQASKVGCPSREVNEFGENCNQISKIIGCHSCQVYRYKEKIGRVPIVAEMLLKLYGEVKK